MNWIGARKIDFKEKMIYSQIFLSIYAIFFILYTILFIQSHFMEYDVSRKMMLDWFYLYHIDAGYKKSPLIISSFYLSATFILLFIYFTFILIFVSIFKIIKIKNKMDKKIIDNKSGYLIIVLLVISSLFMPIIDRDFVFNNIMASSPVLYFRSLFIFISCFSLVEILFWTINIKLFDSEIS